MNLRTDDMEPVQQQKYIPIIIEPAISLISTLWHTIVAYLFGCGTTEQATSVVVLLIDMTNCYWFNYKWRYMGFVFLKTMGL